MTPASIRTLHQTIYEAQSLTSSPGRVSVPDSRRTTMRTSALARAAMVPLALLALAALLASPTAAYPERTGWDREFPAPAYGDVVLADFAGGDGRTDLAAVDLANGSLWIYEGHELGLPQEPGTLVPTGSIVDLAVGDIDGDGRSDLLGVDDRGVSRLDGAEWSPVLDVNASGAHRVAVGDFSGDGRADLAVLQTKGVAVWYQNASGQFGGAPAHVLSDNVAFDDLVAGDLDGDGRDDLAIAKAYEVRVYRQGPQDLELVPEQLGTGAPGEAGLGVVQTAGDIPVLTVMNAEAVTDGTVGFWRWDGERFRHDASIRGPFAPRFAVGDVNDDRRADVVIERRDGSLAVYLQRAAAAFSLVGPDWVLQGQDASDPRVAIGDVNGDTYADILLRGRVAFYVYLQEDTLPRLVRTIPPLVVNRNALARDAVDLRQFFWDDHNRLTFSVVLQSDPEHVSASLDGSLLGLEAADWVGDAEFRVSAWDENPNHAPIESNRFLVTVNDIPAFTSDPVRRAVVGRLYRYEVTVTDAYPATDRPAFGLSQAPQGMAIDPVTGLVTWTPGATQVGVKTVAVEVRDGSGGLTVQEFEIVVVPAPIGPPTALLAVGIAATSAALVAAAALINENAKYLFLLFFVPLYSKIKRERVLDHFVRGQIFGYIQANPGEHYNAIKDALGLTNGSLAHHLRTLEREQFIRSKRFGLYRRFYPFNFRLPADDAFQPNDVQVMILRVIRGSPGITQKDIADRLGLTPPTVNYHVSVLSDRNLIRVERRGRSTHCTVVEGTQT